jgi:hypothetical protein
MKVMRIHTQTARKGKAMSKHIYDMNAEELARLVCFGYEGHPCTNTMDEYGCRNSMKDNEPFCSECCADTNDGACCG